MWACCCSSKPCFSHMCCLCMRCESEEKLVMWFLTSVVLQVCTCSFKASHYLRICVLKERILRYKYLCVGLCVFSISSPENENTVIIYSLSCDSKLVWLSPAEHKNDMQWNLTGFWMLFWTSFHKVHKCAKTSINLSYFVSWKRKLWGKFWRCLNDSFYVS